MCLGFRVTECFSLSCQNTTIYSIELTGEGGGAGGDVQG